MFTTHLNICSGVERFNLQAEYQNRQASNDPEKRQYLDVKQITGTEGVKVQLFKC